MANRVPSSTLWHGAARNRRDIIKSEWQVILSGPCYLNDIDGLISLIINGNNKKKKREGSYGFCLIFGESIHRTGCYIKEI